MKGAETKMLQLKNVVKTYKTGDAVQDALKGVSVSFRDNEFVSVLGQSGSTQPVKAQMASPEVNVLNGMKFEIPSDEEKTQSTKEYLASLSQTEKAGVYKMISLLGMGESLTGGDRGGQKASEAQTVPAAPMTDVNETGGGILDGITDFFGGLFDSAVDAVEDVRNVFSVIEAFNDFRDKNPDFDFDDIGSIMDGLQSGNIEDVLGAIDNRVKDGY